MKGIRFYLGEGHNEVFAIDIEPASKARPELFGCVSHKRGIVEWGCVGKTFPRRHKLLRITEKVATRLAPALIKELNEQE